MLDNELSDLFFNITKENYGSLLFNAEAQGHLPSVAECENALLMDAKAFVAQYPKAIALYGYPTPIELVNDFKARL